MAEAWQVPKNNSAINIEFFSERVSGVVVDRASKTVRNVCLSGLTSKKGYGYRKEALASAISQYNGASVFCDHADDNKSPRDRKLKELAGCVEKARICESSGKPYGDLKLIGPNTDWLLDLFEQSPKNVGMSHVIKGRKNKQNEIDYIESVVSVDIVAFPATTSSFSEQDNSDMELKEVLKGKKPVLERIKLICEQADVDFVESDHLLPDPVQLELKTEADLRKLASTYPAVATLFAECDGFRKEKLARQVCKKTGLDVEKFSESLVVVDNEASMTVIAESLRKAAALGKVEEPESGQRQLKKPAGVAGDKKSLDENRKLIQESMAA